MNDAPSHPPAVRIAGRLQAAVGRRLQNGWDDPSAWRVICEELAAVWRDHAAVRWALVLLRPETCPSDVPRAPCGSVGWSRSDDSITWQARDGLREFWSQLAGRGGEFHGDPAAAALGLGPLLPDDPDTRGWLVRGVAVGRQHALAVVLGLSRPPTALAADDPVRTDLAATADAVAPLAGQQRRLAALDAEATTLREDCATLSRLGDLRTRLAAVTAHELKTPLTSITAYAEVLEQQIAEPQFHHAEEFLRVIRSEADRLLRLVDRFLDSSRRGRGQTLGTTRPLDVVDLARGVLDTMAPQAATRDLRLRERLAEDVPRVDGDADLVRQTLVNLLGNAFKFTPPGGQVVLAVRDDAAMVRLEVADSGPGIPPHELRAIFQSFYRARGTSDAEGVGLGLSIVKEIVALHGGHLDVHSRPGRGATFGVLLPKAQAFRSHGTALAALGCDPAVQQRLARHTLGLVAELAGARVVGILLPSAEGSAAQQLAGVLGLDAAVLGIPVAAAALGLPAGSAEARLVRGADVLPTVLTGATRAGDTMVAPLALGLPGEDAPAPRGALLLTRRLGGGVFGDDDVLLLSVLAEILGRAWSEAVAPGRDRRTQEGVADALAALSGLRRTGVPTADPLALRLLSRTGRRLGLSAFATRLLQYAGALHDAGMVLVDPDVALKPSPLDLDERDHVDRHPQRGLDLLGPLVAVPELREIIRHHHERVDGRGYPEGRRGEAIPLGARILAVVDAFFAMIRSRPWRQGRPVAEAMAELQRHVGTQFDDRVVAAFQGVLLEEGLLPEPASPPVGGGPRRS